MRGGVCLKMIEGEDLSSWGIESEQNGIITA